MHKIIKYVFLASISLVIAPLCWGVNATALAEEDRFGLEQSLNTPSWLTLRGSHRTRFEVLNGDPQFGRFNGSPLLNIPNDDVDASNTEDGVLGLISLQTSIFAEARWGRVRFGAELLDARSYNPIANRNCEPDFSGFSTAFQCFTPSISARSNAVEPIQSYVAIDLGDRDNPTEILLGRFAMDIGSGRLIARSPFRTTIQSYFGGKVETPLFKDDRLTVFYTIPEVNQDEFNNEIRYDFPDEFSHFWGAHYSYAALPANLELEAYTYGLGDDQTLAALLTPGLRLHSPSVNEKWSFDIEAAAQVTRIPRSSSIQSGVAFFVHSELSRRFGNRERWRGTLLFDYASGSSVETVNSILELPVIVDNQFGIGLEAGDTAFLRTLNTSVFRSAFNPLFGDFTRDFGPEGLFGALSRSNIISPGIRLEMSPSDRINIAMTYRATREAERFPSFIVFRPQIFPSRTEAENSQINVDPGIVPAVNHQVDARTQYWVVPGNVKLEIGGAFITDRNAERTPPQLSEIFDRVSTINQPSPALYGYTSLTFSF